MFVLTHPPSSPPSPPANHSASMGATDCHRLPQRASRFCKQARSFSAEVGVLNCWVSVGHWAFGRRSFWRSAAFVLRGQSLALQLPQPDRWLWQWRRRGQGSGFNAISPTGPQLSVNCLLAWGKVWGILSLGCPRSLQTSKPTTEGRVRKEIRSKRWLLLASRPGDLDWVRSPNWLVLFRASRELSRNPPSFECEVTITAEIPSFLRG